MTPKQLAFVGAYFIEPTQKAAALAAGYGIRSAEVSASRLMRHPEIIAAIARMKSDGCKTATERGEDSTALTPLAYMLSVVNDQDADESRRDRMASAAAAYMHPKVGEGGKKEQAVRAARVAGGGKFSAAAPPKLVVNNR